VLIRLLRAYLRPYRKAIAALVVLQLVQTLATLYLPTLNADIIDNGVLTGDTGYIMRIGAVMLAITLVQVTCAIGAVHFGAATAMALGRDLRHAVFHRVQQFSAREVGRFGTPSLITRNTNDVQQVQMLAVMTFTLLVSAPIMSVGGIILALHLDVAAVLAPAGGRSRAGHHRDADHQPDAPAVPADASAHRRHQRRAPRADQRRPRDPRLRARPQERDRFGTANTDLFDTSLAVGRLIALMFPSVMLVLNVSSIAVLWFGAHGVASGGLQIGALTAFLSYLLQMADSIGGCNGSLIVEVVVVKRGRLPLPRDRRVAFWAGIRAGLSWREAAAGAGVAGTAQEWFRRAGGVKGNGPAPVSGRYLSLAEREEIAVGLAAGLRPAQIAARLGRDRSTVYREIGRNSGSRGRGGYRALVAQARAEERAARPKTARLAGNDRLRDWVQQRLEERWSPEQVSVMLKAEFPDDGEMRVSHETITRRFTCRAGARCAGSWRRACGPAGRCASRAAGKASGGAGSGTW